MSDQPDQPDPVEGPIDGPVDGEPVDDARDPVQRPADLPSSAGTPFAEKVRATFEEYDVERHLGELAAQVEQVVRQGVETVGALAHEHRDDIGGFLSRTAEALDRRTDGRHAETINDVRGQLERGLQRIAEQRPPDGPAAGPDPEQEV
jgi:hypothetical protein